MSLSLEIDTEEILDDIALNELQWNLCKHQMMLCSLMLSNRRARWKQAEKIASTKT